MNKRATGFTLIEVLVVVVVIGILAAIGVTNYASSQARARDIEREADVKALTQALEAYVGQNDRYPQTITATTFGVAVSKNIFKSPGETGENSVLNLDNNSLMGIPSGATRSSYLYVPFINGPLSSTTDISCGSVSTGGVVTPCDSFAILYFNEQADEWRWTTSRKYPPPDSRLTQLRQKLAESGL